jgi:hypothetical protein
MLWVLIRLDVAGEISSPLTFGDLVELYEDQPILLGYHGTSRNSRLAECQHAVLPNCAVLEA